METKRDWETLIGGRALNAAGLLLVFLGTVFFLKTAFGHQLIPPSVRVAMGLVSGATMIAFAQYLAAKGKVYFSEGLTALGAGIEFLSIYASSALFHLASPAQAMAGMIAVTGVMAALAWRHKSMRLAVLAAIGGFATPVLAGTHDASAFSLCGYLVILDAGLLALAAMLETPIIAPLALIGTLLYAIGYFPSADLTGMQTAGVYVALYVPFAVAGWIVARRGKLGFTSAIVGAVAFAAMVIGIESSLHGEHNTALAVTLLTIAVLHLAVAIITRSRYHSWLSAGALTFAIPAAFNGAAVNVAWAAEAAVLSIAGVRYRDDALRCAGLGVLTLDLLHELGLYETYTAIHPILNGRFLSGVATIVSTFLIADTAQRLGTTEYEAPLARVLRTTAHVAIFTLLSVETWDGVMHFADAQAASAALSVCWAALSAVFIGWGLFKRDAFLRWEGLGLVIATAAKVFLVDLTFLDMNNRVISAILVGVALIGISYAYQRYVSRSEKALV